MREKTVNGCTTMNIGYSVNRYYLPYTTVSMHSLLAAGRGKRGLRILLAADQDLTMEDLQPMARMVSAFPGCSLEVRWPLTMTPRRFVSDESCVVSRDAVQVAYFRLFLPQLFEGEEKCLYLDGDMVITRSLEDLYDTEMNGACLAGVTDRLCLEEPQIRRMKEDWGIEPGYYVNAGALLMNLKEMRASGGDREALEMACTKAFRYLDQDVLNQVYRGKVRLVPKAYNVFPDDRGEDLNFLRGLLPEHRELFPDTALSDPAIIHYIGPRKPWVFPDAPLGQAWQEAEEACKKTLGALREK